MAADQRLTPVELVFMQVIWDIGEASAEAVRAALTTRGIEWTAGGVRRILGILVRDLLHRAFGGSVAGMAAVLFDGASLTPDEYHRITELVAGCDPLVR